MKTNVVLVGNLDKQTKNFAIKLAEDFDLYFADVNDIIDYKLFNSSDIEAKCGREYLDKLKKGIVKEIGTFENTLICVPHFIYLEGGNYNFFNTYGTVIFLDFSKNILQKQINSETDDAQKKALEVELTVFDEKETLCKEHCDVSIDILKDGFENNYKKIKKVIEEYYL